MRLRALLHGPRAASLVLLAAGCATVPEGAGFDDVQHTVEERIGRRTVWYRGSAEDAAVQQAVDAMLAKPLGAADAVQIALLANERLQAVYEDLGVAQAELVQAGLLKNPVFDLGARLPSGGGRAELDLQVAEDFLHVFLIPLRTRIASAEFEATKARVAAAVLDVAAGAREAFLRLQAEMQMVDLDETVAQATAASLATARAIHAAGNIRDLDLAQERVLDDLARLELAQARGAVVERRAELDALMGLWGHRTKWSLAPRLPDVPAEEIPLHDVEPRAVAASLDLDAARHAIDAAGERMGLTGIAAAVSNVDLGVDAERDDGGWAIGPTLSLPIPIFDQGQAAAAAAEAELRRRVASYRAQAVELRGAVRAAAQRLATARSTALFYRDEVVPLRVRITADTQLQYNAMQVGAFQLLAAKEREIDAGRRSALALRDYWLARAALEHVLAGGSPQRAPEARREREPAIADDEREAERGFR